MKLVSTTHVAHALGVIPKTVTQWAKAGKLPVVTLPSGRLRFDAVAIAGYMAKNGYPDDAIRGLMDA